MENRLPTCVEIKVGDLAEIAIHCWKLSNWLSAADPQDGLTGPRYALRKLNKLLLENRVSTIDLIGKKFDAGLAIEVVDSVDSAVEQSEPVIIGEMISPIVLWNDIVIKHGQVVLHNRICIDEGAAEERCT